MVFLRNPDGLHQTQPGKKLGEVLIHGCTVEFDQESNAFILLVDKDALPLVENILKSSSLMFVIERLTR